MKLTSFMFSLDHISCREGCRRWEIISFVCHELSMLREHWKTTRVVVTGTRDQVERRLVHTTYDFATK